MCAAEVEYWGAMSDAGVGCCV